MRFWKLDAQRGEGDYWHAFVNGSLDHPFGMPGIKCDTCNETWSNFRIRRETLPKSLRRIRALKNRWPLDVDKFNDLRTTLHEKAGLDHLQPGDRFFPAYLSCPSTPRYDLLWPDLGTPIVSEKARKALLSIDSSIEFAPIVIEKAGKLEPSDAFPNPPGGEPEDIIKACPMRWSKSGLGPYYRVIVNNESHPPDFRKDPIICEKCGRSQHPVTNSHIAMTSEMWRGHDIFILQTTLHLLLTDKAKTALENASLTNLNLRDYNSPKSDPAAQ